MRKKIYMVLLCALFLGACASGKKEGATGQGKSEVLFDKTSSVSGDGIVYIADRGIAHFYDSHVKQDTVLCSRPNCSHAGESSTNPNPSCDAFLGVLTRYPAIQNGSLYYLVQEGFSWDSPSGIFQKSLYQAEVNGTNRKKLAELSHAELVLAADYGEDSFALSYYCEHDEEGNALEKYRTGIATVNLQSGKSLEIASYEGYNAMIRCDAFPEKSVLFLQLFNRGH